MAGASLQYFTDRVDAALASTVRGINGSHDQFATDFLGDATQDDDNRVSVQLRAWRKPGGESWQIDRLTRLGAAMGHAVKQEHESRSALCFFDALEYCASFQMVQLQVGNIVFPAQDENNSIASYRDAAKNAGQVIDIDGRLHPCAYGQILGEGFFNGSDLALAQTTITKVPVPAASSSFSVAALLPPLPVANALVARNNGDMINQMQGQESLTRIFQRAIHTGTEMVDAINNALWFDFNHNRPVREMVSFGMASLLTVGILPAKLFLQGNYGIATIHGFHATKRSFAKAVEALPREEDKLILREFIKSAEVVFELEHALKILAHDKGKSVGGMKKALALIDSACRIAGYNEADTQRTKQAIVDGAVRSGHFYEPFAKQWSPFLMNVIQHFNDGVNFSWAEMYQAAYDNPAGAWFCKDPLLASRVSDKLLKSPIVFYHDVASDANNVRQEDSLVAMLHSQIPAKTI